MNIIPGFVCQIKMSNDIIAIFGFYADEVMCSRYFHSGKKNSFEARVRRVSKMDTCFWFAIMIKSIFDGTDVLSKH